MCGQFLHTGSPVVLWLDPGGYDAYRTERRFVPLDQAEFDPDGRGPDSPNRFGLRRGLDPETAERVRGGGWDRETLSGVVDQFVLHYDVCGTSRKCFQVLHDLRGLSVHFLLDIDGTIYQTLDVKERAWHATIANDRSIGIEIANIGAYPSADAPPLRKWYGSDGVGPVITIPGDRGDGGVRTPGFVGRPRGGAPVRGVINGRELVQWDLTPEQYESLANLTATLLTAFPRMRCEAPTDASGTVLDRVLTPAEFAGFSGILGHWHVQAGKVDPGPALDWSWLLRESRRRMGAGAGDGAF